MYDFVDLKCINIYLFKLSLSLQLKKIQEKLRKHKQDVESLREKYDACLNDLNSYNAKYIEDMTEVCIIYTVEPHLPGHVLSQSDRPDSCNSNKLITHL